MRQPSNNKQQQQQQRSRGRSRKPINLLSKTFESNGPDVKIKGTAQQIADKYITLGRDASSSGDRVLAESLLQHAEHYLRIIASAQPSREERESRDNRGENRDNREQRDNRYSRNRFQQNERNNVEEGAEDTEKLQENNDDLTAAQHLDGNQTPEARETDEAVIAQDHDASQDGEQTETKSRTTRGRGRGTSGTKRQSAAKTTSDASDNQEVMAEEKPKTRKRRVKITDVAESENSVEQASEGTNGDSAKGDKAASQEEEAKPAPKRRGRPPKAKKEESKSTEDSSPSQVAKSVAAEANAAPQFDLAASE